MLQSKRKITKSIEIGTIAREITGLAKKISKTSKLNIVLHWASKIQFQSFQKTDHSNIHWMQMLFDRVCV